jgi:hypothetical protein
MIMDDKKPESRTTATEGIGSRGGDAVPDAVKEAAQKAPEKAEETVGLAKTGEAVGESVSDAYADPAHHSSDKPIGEANGVIQQAAAEAGSQARDLAGDMLTTGRQTAQAVSHQFNEQPFLTVLAGFGLVLLIHGRR